MCAILDANTVSEVFGPNRPPAGEKFFDWLSKPRGQLVVGGKVLDELRQDDRFRKWLQEAVRSARIRQFADDDLAPHAAEIARTDFRSNDEHVLALASASGAGLLYTNDQTLIEDFKNPHILPNPGKVYTTGRTKDFTKAHRRLLARRDLCRKPA